MSDEFGFDFDEGMVDGELYRDTAKEYTSVTWLCKGHPGFWAVNDTVDGSPEPYWTQTMHQFGQDPNIPETGIWRTERLRCVVIGQRKRAIIEDANGVEYYYPLMTPKAQRVVGRFKSHFQIMVLVPGIAEPVVLAFKGKTRSTAWSNPESGKYHNSNYPVGAEVQLQAYSERASRQVGSKIPWMCSWVVDLVPVVKDGEPYFVQEGDVYMNPFQIDLRTGENLPKTRYVGQAEFLVNQGLRKELAVPWEKQWEDAEAMAVEEDNQDYDNPHDEDIPF